MLVRHLEQQILCIDFAINTTKLVSDLDCLCGHCDTFPKIFDKSSITTAKLFDNSKEEHSSCKQCVCIYKRLFCFAKCLLGTPKPLNRIVPMQASRFCKTLFQHSVGVRSHHVIVMITGFGIASQQANEHGRILILRVNVAFVRTKALLARTISG